MCDGIKPSWSVRKTTPSTGTISIGGVLWMSLHCKDGQGSNSEVGETHCSGKSKDSIRQREKSQWGVPWLCLGRLSIERNGWWLFCFRWSFSANKHCKVNSALLLAPVNKSQFLCSWFEPPFLSWREAPGEIPFLQPMPRIWLQQPSPSPSYSHSPAQSLLPLLQHPFQNPIGSVDKNNGKLLPSCQTPLQVFLFPLPSLTQNALSKTFSVPLCQCNLVINTFTLSPWTSARAHNCGLVYS